MSTSGDIQLSNKVQLSGEPHLSGVVAGVQ